MTQTQHGTVPTAPAAAGQTVDDVADRYARDGYVVVPGAFTPAEVAELRAEALRIFRGEAGAVAGMEPGPPDESDEEIIRRYACIHFPHKLSPLMRQTLAHPVVVAALTRVIGPDVKAWSPAKTPTPGAASPTPPGPTSGRTRTGAATGNFLDAPAPGPPPTRAGRAKRLPARVVSSRSW